MVDSKAVDVVSVIHQARFAGLPLMVSILTVLAMVFDGFDIQVIGFVAPQLLKDWGLQRSDLGPILAAGLVGMALGAFVLGEFGDRVGRRWGLIGSLMVVAAMSLGAAYAESPQSLMWWRLLTGIGLGGVVPNATALMVEYAPGSVRNVIVALTIVGVPIGGVLGAEVAAQILPVYGWRAVFLIGAALPLLLAIAMIWLLPESPRFLARDSRRHDQLAQVLNRVIAATRFSSSDRFMIAQEASTAPVGVRSLFGRDMRRETLLIWLIFVTNIFAVYAFFNWLPTVLTSVGLSQTVALRGALFFNLGGVIASLIVAGLTARWGSRPVLIALGVGAIVFTAAMGLLGDASRSETLLIAIMTLAGACILSIQVTMYAVAANVYPTAARATGVGWASGFARIGGILSSFSGGVLLSMGSGLAPFFLGIAAVLLLTTLGIVLLRRHSPANA